MLEGAQHPDRDAWFRYINSQVTAALDSGDPVISIDTKKKELVGRFAQAGQEWRRSGDPEEVETYDFPDLADGKAIPYGVYDMADDSAWVSVGVDHDTSVFAVATIERWWHEMGRVKYPDARELVITADGGGSNGHRTWLWKHELARLASAIGHRPGHRRLSLPTWHQQVEQDRASVVLPDHPQLARPAPHDLPDHREPHLPAPPPEPASPCAASSTPATTPPRHDSPTCRRRRFPSSGTRSTATGTIRSRKDQIDSLFRYGSLLFGDATYGLVQLGETRLVERCEDGDEGIGVRSFPRV